MKGKGREEGAVDVLMNHPSISRLHAVVQFSDAGEVFLYDTSVHGTKVNKKRIEPKQYERLRVGDVIKFGESTRIYVLHGPERLRYFCWLSWLSKKMRAIAESVA